MSGNGTTIVINTVGTKFGLVNTEMGTYDSDGKLNVSGLALGGISTFLGAAEMFGKSSSLGQIVVGIGGAYSSLVALQKIKRSTERFIFENKK